MNRAYFLLIPGFLATALPAAAQVQDAPQCTAPADELAPWSNPVPLNSANYVSQLPEAQLLPGKAIELGLHPVDAVKFPVAPGKPGGNGGLVELTIAEAGTYRVALSTGAWIDLVRDGKAVESSAHGHASICGVRKMVEFPLQPGKYVLALSANLELRSQVLVTKAPLGAAPLHP